MTLDEFKAYTQEVKQRAEGYWDQIIPALATAIAHAFDKPGVHVCCPHHPGKSDKNLRAFPNVAMTGRVICNTCGGTKDGFGTIMWSTGWSFADTVKAVDDWLGGSVRGLTAEEIQKREAEHRRKAEAMKKAQEAEDARSRRNLNAVWSASVPLTHPAAEPGRKYFAWRGLPAHYPSELRFHPCLTYWDMELKDGKKVFVDRGRFPAIVARFKTVDGKPGTLHRIYLTPDGRKLDLCEDAKKMMGHPSTVSLTGGAIRLSPTTPRIIGVAEGIETALAASALHGIAVWSCYSATLLEAFTPPAGVEKVIIFADLDTSKRGEEAAKKLATRLWEMGIMAGIRLPEGQIPDGSKGIDWLDVLNARNGKSDAAATEAAKAA